MNIVERIDLEIEKRSLLKHPFYRMWSDGKLTVDHLQGYSKEYFQLVKAVPDMVETIASSCDSSTSSLVADSAAEEIEHVVLWERFAKSLGVENSELVHHDGATKTKYAVDSLQELSRLPFEQAAAALYAYEADLPKISRSKIDGLKKFYDLSSEDATKYFEVHEEADVRHARLWRDILLAAPSDQHDSIIDSAMKSLAAQNILLDSVLEKYVRVSC